MENLSKALAAVVGVVASFFTGIPPLMWALLGTMSMDYITGIICGYLGVSTKTQGGGLSSRAAFVGLLKKMTILLLVLLAVIIDYAIANSAGISFNAITGAVCLWFIASEGLSVIENAAELDVGVPKVLKRALEVMKDTGDDEDGDAE